MQSQCRAEPFRRILRILVGTNFRYRSLNMRRRSNSCGRGRPLVEVLESRKLLSAAPDGTIVFMSNRDGNYEIYSMTPDGLNLKNLTNNAATDAIPQVSDDG